MKLTQLRVENVKRIEAVEVELDPGKPLVVIGGRNAQGKSSLIDAIAMALGGRDLVPMEPLRRGAERGSVEIVTDEGLRIERRFTPKGDRLIVSNAEGATFRSPQALLDGLVGKIAFDPLAFDRMKPAEQVATLRAAVGVDLTGIEEARKAAYDERTVQNREVKRLEALVDSMPQHDDVGMEERSTQDLTDALGEIEKARDEVVALRERWNAETNECINIERAIAIEQDRVRDWLAQIESLRAEIDAATEQEQELKGKLATRREIEQKLAASVAEAETGIASTDSIVGQLAEIDAHNRKARENAEGFRQSANLERARTLSATISARITNLDEEKAAAIREAGLPVEGLELGETGVRLRGLPYEQASSAERLEVSVALGIALNPKLRILLVREGSVLDEEHLALVAQMAADADMQVFMECVGNREDAAVVIEDGRVQEGE